MEYGVQLAGGAAQLRPQVLGLLLQTPPRPFVGSQQEVTLLQALLGCRQCRLHTTILSLTTHEPSQLLRNLIKMIDPMIGTTLWSPSVSWCISLPAPCLS